MTPIELKQWQSDLDLSELAMAAYIGVPVHTLRGWIKGTRKPDAAPLRLMHLLQMIETRAPVLHADLIRESRTNAPVTRGPGRPAKTAPADQIEPGDAPATPEVSEVPEWLKNAL